ncbi:MAG TPA: DUF2723 domain-containing protein [Bacteroidales bacterium]|nr:DUF2723 domain-containing protein [Bacteroidales bacterium]
MIRKPDQYNSLNNLIGWITLVLSASVYLLTVEPTVSFWDCGEFILSAWKLQVGHPPGAPFFLILGRIFSLFSLGDQSKAAMMINILSALASAFTIMFLFWTITHITRRIITRGEQIQKKQIVPVLFAGLIGALGYAFSDTFWFSAVEGEVYATSSLFTAVVFWAILKWEEEKPKFSGRWIILIAYLMGLSIGVHLLNLLVIPAIVLVFYFKNYRVTAAGVAKTLLFSAGILGVLVFILLPYIVKIAGWFEIIFVNGVGLPYNSGLYIYLLLLIGGLVWGIKYSITKKRKILNYSLTILTVIMLGYSSYAMIMIRAQARPPMNQNDPSDLFSLIYYINREQYGSTPLFTGAYYSAPVKSVKEKVAGYIKEDGKYKKYQRNNYVFDERFTTGFPRMYSTDRNHIREYEYWGDIKGEKISINTSQGPQDFVCPTFTENLRFFFKYQVGYMYWRYFLWNFVGRQNDIQGNGNVLNGNWISGINALDSNRLGDQETLPDDLRKNPARNTYFFLPLLFGLLGIGWQYLKDKNSLIVIAILFIMTGLAIVVYLNQYPLQPRERDYAYSGSFYAFSIWIGMGFFFIYESLLRLMNHKISVTLAMLVSLLAVPVLLVMQNWDDHDRSGRYTARDIGANYLNSCAENAILFTYGDNDSFPVWYAQDVEGIRTDIRVANLSYLSAGWYIDMMRQKAYESEPLPFSLPSEKYRPGEREQLPVYEQVNRPYNIQEIVDFVGLDDKRAKIDFTGRGDFFNYVPAARFIIPVDSSQVLANGTVKDYQTDRLLENVIWTYKGSELYKNDLAILDMIATNNWERPIYYATTVPPSNYRGLEEYFQMEGLAYRIVPLDTTGTISGDAGYIDTKEMYENVMNRFKWGNANDPHVYLDENNRRMFNNFRRMFGILALRLVEEGDTLKAKEVIDRGLEIIPREKIEYDYYAINLVEAYLQLGDAESAVGIMNSIIERSKQYLDYIIRLNRPERYGLDLETALSWQSVITLLNISSNYGLDSIFKELEPELNMYYNELYYRPG